MKHSVGEIFTNNAGTRFTRTLRYREFFWGWLVIGTTTPWVSDPPNSVTMLRPFPTREASS